MLYLASDRYCSDEAHYTAKHEWTKPGTFNCQLHVQYRSDARYKSNALIASDKRVYRWQQTRLTLLTNVFITEGKRI